MVTWLPTLGLDAALGIHPELAGAARTDASQALRLEV